MRVAIDYTAAVNQTGGIGRLVRQLVAELVALDEGNQYVLLHARPGGGRAVDPPVAPHVSVRQLPLDERWLTIAWQRLALPIPADLATGPIDVFHGPNFSLPPLRRGRTVVTVHDLAFRVRPECAHPRLRAYLEQVVPRAVARADYVVADSEQSRRDVIEHFDAPAERVVVVPGGVDRRFTPAPSDDVARVRRSYGLDQPYVLTVGVIEPRKNLPRLIDAFARWRRRSDAPHLLVIAGGRGWLSDPSYRAVTDSPYAASIRLTGYVADRDLPALYTGADVFAYPSLYEGFGLPVLEAMACGAPVVCSRTSSLPEFAAGAAELVDPEDPDDIAAALDRVCADPALQDALRQRGRTRAAEYTWERAARRQLEVYARAAGAARTTRRPGVG